MSTPTPRPSVGVGGFVPQASAQALRDVADKQAAVDASLPLDLWKPTSAEETEGAAFAFRHKDTDGWTVEGTVARGPKGLLISHLDVRAGALDQAPHGVTTRILQRIPVEKILASIRARAALEEAQREGTRKILGEEPAPGFFTHEDAKPAPVRKNAVTDDLLRQVALTYLAETAADKPPGALKRMAEEFSRPEKTIQGWISRARRAGWLGPGARGRTGAEPGPKLLAWMGKRMQEARPIMDEASRIAEELGATVRGQVRAAIRAYEQEEEQALAKQLGVHPLVACIASEVLFGKPLSVEVTERATQSGSSTESALNTVGQEVHQLLAGKGITVTLPTD